MEGREGGKVRLVGKLDGRGNTTIQVCDNGPGILKEVQERIFIPFFTTKQEGSGIRLSLSRQIMRLHSISARNRALGFDSVAIRSSGVRDTQATISISWT